jgi:hypothetical protein
MRPVNDATFIIAATCGATGLTWLMTGEVRPVDVLAMAATYLGVAIVSQWARAKEQGE